MIHEHVPVLQPMEETEQETFERLQAALLQVKLKSRFIILKPCMCSQHNTKSEISSRITAVCSICQHHSLFVYSW